MASTVIEAFEEFLRDSVNLSQSVTRTARSSRDWLVEQAHRFPEKDTAFPKLWTEIDIFFGSFARNTKKRPLDDIDLMIGLHGNGSTYYAIGEQVHITVNNENSNQRAFCHENTIELNSRRIINKFISLLKEVPQYENTIFSRNGEAATLKLASYEWNFDVVPCFITTADDLGRTYYLIPDGDGHWKKTDPRLDRNRVFSTNTRHEGHVLNVIRIMKFWNKRPTMPSIPSYMFENLLLNYYEQPSDNTASKFVDIEIPGLLEHIYYAIFDSVQDPKNIQGDLNTLNYGEKIKIRERAAIDYAKAVEARKLESEQHYEASIKKWADVFGPDFPDYG